MKPAHLVFVHGWGFGPDFWEPLRSRLPDFPCTVLDLGFFGPERLELPGGIGEPLVAVGHSLGVMFLLRQAHSPFKALMSLGGFGRFDVPPGPVRAMRRKLSRDAAQVLSGFYRACGLPPENDPDTSAARPDRLAEGLDHLLEWDERAGLEAFNRPLLALADPDDAVVVPILSRASFARGLMMLPHDPSRGGHAFPFTRADECARLMTAFLETL